MGLRANAKSSSRDGLHKKVTMNVHDMKTIAAEMVLTDEAGTKADAPLVAKMIKRPVVGKDVPAEDRGGFAKGDIVLVEVLCQM